MGLVTPFFKAPNFTAGPKAYEEKDRANGDQYNREEGD
jgi:hypothetical protein